MVLFVCAQVDLCVHCASRDVSALDYSESLWAPSGTNTTSLVLRFPPGTVNCQSPDLVCLGIWPVISVFESFRPSPYSALVSCSNLGKLQGLSYSSRQTSGGGGASAACDSTTLEFQRVLRGHWLV